jgi:NTE family protein
MRQRDRTSHIGAVGFVLVTLLAVTTWGWFDALQAAELSADPEGRPKVGLVLSGGGARGSAHVGVLKVMEELRIPVDFVVGTSMGAIVGGLYSSGLSPDEMEEAFRSVDWSTAFNDKPDRKNISYRRKEDDFHAMMPFEIGVSKTGLATRSGVISGQKINVILRSMVPHTAGIDDFDKLHLPYRAIAADLETGNPVVLASGDLALAIRASMSVPGVFTPVEIDERLLVDGGIAMNLPVEVARLMGAERIIAVDIGTPVGKLSESLSATGVVSHTFSVLNKRNVKEQKKLLREGDFLLVPNLGDLSASDFDRLLEGVAIGEQAARGAEDELRRFSVSEEAFAEFLARQRTTHEESRDTVTVDRIIVRGLTHTDPEFITKRLDSQPNMKLTAEDVNRDIVRIHQLGEYETVDMRLVTDEEGRTLLFDAREKGLGPGFLRFGLGFETNMDGDSDFRAITNFRLTGINRRGGEWKSVMSFGAPLALETELFQPLDWGGIQWFVAPNLHFTREKDERFLPDGALEGVKSEEVWAGVDVGVQLRNWGEIRLGAGRGTYKANIETTAMFPEFDANLGGWRLSATMDQVDNAAFPKKGSLVKVNGFLSEESLGADFEYEKLSLLSWGAWTGRKNTIIGGLKAGTDLGSDIPFFDEFELGGFLNLSGFARGELQGDVMGLATLGYYWQTLEWGALKRGLYVGGFLQAGNVWSGVDDVEVSDLVYSGTVFVGVETLLAPIYVGWGRAEAGHDEFYVFIGRPFN